MYSKLIELGPVHELDQSFIICPGQRLGCGHTVILSVGRRVFWSKACTLSVNTFRLSTCSANLLTRIELVTAETATTKQVANQAQSLGVNFMCLCPKTSFAPTFAPVLVFCKPFAGQSPAGTPSLMLPFSGRPPADGRRMGGEIIGAGYPGLPSRCSVALGYTCFAPSGLENLGGRYPRPLA